MNDVSGSHRDDDFSLADTNELEDGLSDDQRAARQALSSSRASASFGRRGAILPSNPLMRISTFSARSPLLSCAGVFLHHAASGSIGTPFFDSPMRCGVRVLGARRRVRDQLDRKLGRPPDRDAPDEKHLLRRDRPASHYLGP